ncbi:MAG: glycosyltransferase family 9 protein [Bacillota bacterium]|nr:glycosyltransferase family 9 protein [Bacillota bacterium]
MKILVLRLHYIGDVLFTGPALRLLRRRLPGARVDLLVQRWTAPVAARLPGADRVLTYEPRGSHRGAAGLLRLVRQLRAERYDAVLDLHGNLKSHFLGRASGAPVRVGFSTGRGGWLLTHRLPYRQDLPIVDLLAGTAQVAAAAVEGGLRPGWQQLPGEPAYAPGERRLEIPLEPEEREAARRRLAEELRPGGPRILLQLGANWPSKRWPVERWAGLARLLLERLEARLILTGGAAEEAAQAELLRLLGLPGGEGAGLPRGDGAAEGGGQDGRILPLAGRTSLLETAALEAESDLVIAPDTGALYLGAAVGARVIGLYGPTDPARLGPLGPGGVALAARPSCWPCWAVDCPLGRNRCLADLDEERVFRVAAELLRRAPAPPGGVAARGETPSAG